MNTIRNAGMLLCVFLLGCAMTGIVGPLLVPPVRAGSSPQKWEQLCVPWNDEATGKKTVQHPYVHAANLPTGWNSVLAAYGEQGWELVGSVGDTPVQISGFCFKRPR